MTGKKTSGGKKKAPSMDNYQSDPSSGSYPAGQSAYPQQGTAADPTANYPSASTLPSADTSGSFSDQVIFEEGPEDWPKMKENPNKRAQAPSDWEKYILWTSDKRNIAPFCNPSGKAITGYLVPDDYHVHLQFVAFWSKGPWRFLSKWLDTGLRLHHFKKNFTELVCKWIFTRSANPSGKFMQKWRRVFGNITPDFLENADGNKWYYKYRHADWEQENPGGLPKENDPFDTGNEGARAKKGLEALQAAAPSNPKK